MRNWNDRIENLGATADGRLSAAEDNCRFKELENAVSTSGIVLDPNGGPDSDFTMLAQAMGRYASGAVFGDDSGAANAYVVTAYGAFVAPAELFHGMRLAFLPANDNTGAATCNAFDIGSKPIYDAAGDPLLGGEITADIVSSMTYDTSLNGGDGAWRLDPWSNVFLTRSITKVVGPTGNFATLDLALTWLKRKIICGGVTVTLLFQAGTHTISAPIYIDHPNADKIIIQGAALTGGGFPVTGDVTITGSSGGARAADTATNLTMLRTRFPTEVQLTGTGCIVCLVPVKKINNLLINNVSSTSGAVSSGALNIENCAVVGGPGALAAGLGVVTLNNFIVAGCTGSQGLLFDRAVANLSGHVGAYSCTSTGLGVGAGSSVAGGSGSIVARGNGGTGIYINLSELVSVNRVISSQNGAAGLQADNGRATITNFEFQSNSGGGLDVRNRGFFSGNFSGNTAANLIQNNTSYGVLCSQGGTALLTPGNTGTLVVSGNAAGLGNIQTFMLSFGEIVAGTGVTITGVGGSTAVQATDQARGIFTSATVTGNYSPAINTNGNGNSYIKV